MICKNPYMVNATPVGCGQCLGCRTKKRGEWTSRILLESMAHEDSAFVTLTYSPEHLPKDLNVHKQEMKDWQKRLRYHTNLPIRFYTIGEYGDQTQRPHYHSAIFGFKGCSSGDFRCTCTFCQTLQKSWQKGHVLNGTLTKDSAAYIAGYVTKKMTTPEHKLEEKLTKLNKNKHKYKEAITNTKEAIKLLNGRKPEFAIMSNRPPIGTGGDGEPIIESIYKMLCTDHGNEHMAEIGDVPQILEIGQKKIYLGKL